VTRTRPTERGMTLVEILISIIVAAAAGLAMARMIMADMRFAENREAWRSARHSSRSGMNLLAADLRMVETFAGVEAAAAGGQDLTIRVPYAFGVLCATSGTTSTVAMLPVDSAMFAAPGFSGFAWRDTTTGRYTYVTTGVSLTLGAPAVDCAAGGITPVPAFGGSPSGQIVRLGGTVPTTLAPGTVFFLFRRVRYELKPSGIFPGRTGLWRTLMTPNLTEELAAPFDAASRFRFHVAGAAAGQDPVPSPLSAMRGVELDFVGLSERAPRGAPSPKALTMVTSVYFQNVTP
jgi:type II secretory pathway pseudopilin PulG